MGEPRLLVPGPVSDGVAGVGSSNNNLDAIDYDGYRWLAWRTAPHHFAGTDPTIHVSRSDDGGMAWELTGSLAFGRDVREPRFFEWDGALFLFCCTLGTNWRRFEPDRVHVLSWDGTKWTDPVPVSTPGAMAWRVRVVDGVPIMSVYRGGSSIYSRAPEPTRVELWTCDDAWSWRPLDPDHPTFHTGGTETEIMRGLSGLVSVTRMEGPITFGSDISVAPDLHAPIERHRIIPNKLDSPLMFQVGQQLYLIARRSLEFDGRFDLGIHGIAPEVTTRIYHRTYWATPKRTSLWKLDEDLLQVKLVEDLPGLGDTCFPALVQESDCTFMLYNYTSPLGGIDLPWLAGQHGPTQIYELQLKFDIADGDEPRS